MRNEYMLENFWNDIPIGKNNAVTYPILRMWWNLNEREVRRVLHELSSFDNGDNYILIRSGKSKGFYKTDDQKEIEAYKRECLNKGRSVFAPVRKINRVLSADKRQFTMTNNLRVIREDRQMKQSTVCAFMQAFDDAFDSPMLSKMENGVCLPTPYQLSKLSEIYGCDPADLVNIDLFF
jgi:hypothetical protein